MYTFVSDYGYEYCALLAQQILVYNLRAYIYLMFSKPSGKNFYSVNKPQ